MTDAPGVDVMTGTDEPATDEGVKGSDVGRDIEGVNGSEVGNETDGSDIDSGSSGIWLPRQGGRH